MNSYVLDRLHLFPPVVSTQNPRLLIHSVIVCTLNYLVKTSQGLILFKRPNKVKWCVLALSMCPKSRNILFLSMMTNSETVFYLSGA